MPSQLWAVVFILSNLPNKVYTKQPNIVIIVADDLGYHDVGFRGSHILTPNMDRLAKEGVILENHIVSAICAPSRASLMTGRYPIRTGFWRGNFKRDEEFGLDLDETLLPEMMKRNGYATHGVGKWHLGSHTWEHTPVKRGFETFFGGYLAEQDYFKHTNHGALDFRENYFDEIGHLVDKVRDDLTGQYNTYLFTNKSIELIQSHDQGKPLFLYLAYTAPHCPHQAPAKDVNKFASHLPGAEVNRKYAAKISIMDEGIGKVVDVLTESGMMDNTILLFTSDNGAAFQGSNYPLRGGKRSFLEGGVRGVTFIYSSLLKKSGYTNTNLHHVTDWYATFQKIVGDRPERQSKQQLPIDGVDIWRSINHNKSCRDEILYELRDPSKRLDDTGKIALENAKKYPLDLKTYDVKFRQGSVYNGEASDITDAAQDFFAIRWKNWKLLTGTGIAIQGWTSENGHKNEYSKFLGDNGQKHVWCIASGTFLFDLLTDIREEHNVANKYPDIVKTLLDKKQGYLDKVKTVGKTKINKNLKSMKGVWKPWVEL